MAETPDELAVRYEGIAVKVARRCLYRLPASAADYADLKQVCWLAVLRAARSFDGRRGDWEPYATLVARRAANYFIRVEHRRGLTDVGDDPKTAPKHGPPRTTNLGEDDWWVAGRADPWGGESAAEILTRLARQPWLPPRTLIFADLAVRRGLNMRQIGRLFGVSRESVRQQLLPVREFLAGS